MENKKEIIKNIIIVIIILAIVIYNFLLKKDNTEEFNYSELIVNENIEENKVENKKELIKIYVAGEVNRPGVIEVEEGARIEDAIILSGGTTEQSDLSKINLAYSLEDGQKLYIPSIKENFTNEYITKENGEGIVEGDNNSNSKININTGDVAQLANLPGVGNALAERIVTYREENGKFKNIDDLKNVSGIGEKKYENLKEYICVK